MIFPLFQFTSFSQNKVFFKREWGNYYHYIPGGSKLDYYIIIEAMIGLEIEDETDEDSDILIDELTEKQIIYHGKIAIRRFNEVFKTKVPEDEDTIAGFFFKEIGHIPEVGETMVYHPLHFEVVVMEDNVLKQVKVTKKIKMPTNAH